jgi:hypothetical protein
VISSGANDPLPLGGLANAAKTTRISKCVIRLNSQLGKIWTVARVRGSRITAYVETDGP